MTAPKTLHLTNAHHATSGGVRTFYQALMAAAQDRQRLIRLVAPASRTAVERHGAAERAEIVEVNDKYSLCHLGRLLRLGWFPHVPRPTLVGLSCERMDDNVAAYVGGKS